MPLVLGVQKRGSLLGVMHLPHLWRSHTYVHLTSARGSFGIYLAAVRLVKLINVFSI
jgi:hypothetical protein